VVITPLRRSGIARDLKGSHSFTCTPRIHPLTEWTIPAVVFPAEAGTHLPTPEGWKAELALEQNYNITEKVKQSNWRLLTLNWHQLIVKNHANSVVIMEVWALKVRQLKMAAMDLHLVVTVFAKETAFRLSRATVRYLSKKVVFMMTSVIVTMHKSISCVSSADSLDSFKRKLKFYLFNSCFNVWTVYVCVLL